MKSDQKTVFVSGSFDNIGSRHLRLLQEAARIGPVTVLLWPDKAIVSATGSPAKFPLSERLYFLNAVRYVSRVIPVTGQIDADALPEFANDRPGVWADMECASSEARRRFCQQHGFEYRIITAGQLEGFPEMTIEPTPPGRKKVVVSGLWTEVCNNTFALCAMAEGDYEIYMVADASGGTSKDAHDYAMQRMIQAGVFR